MRGATRAAKIVWLQTCISIHAPHAGRDVLALSTVSTETAISIHAPHAGRDSGQHGFASGGWISIHAPHAGRDRFSVLIRAYTHHFNPRAPCGARRALFSICD